MRATCSPPRRCSGSPTNGSDGFPRVIPIGFYWNRNQIVICTAATAPKVKALSSRPNVAMTIDVGDAPTEAKALLVLGLASVDIVDGVPDEYIAASTKALGAGLVERRAAPPAHGDAQGTPRAARAEHVPGQLAVRPPEPLRERGTGFDADRQIVVFHRWGSDAAGIVHRSVIALNFGPTSQAVWVPLPGGGSSTDLINGAPRMTDACSTGTPWRATAAGLPQERPRVPR